MKISTKLLSIALFATAFTMSIAAADDEVTSDPVVASFDRELNRELTPASMPTRKEIDQDELYVMLNAIHWSSPELAAEALAACQVEVSDDTLDVIEDKRTAYIARCVANAAQNDVLGLRTRQD